MSCFVEESTVGKYCRERHELGHRHFLSDSSGLVATGNAPDSPGSFRSALLNDCTALAVNSGDLLSPDNWTVACTANCSTCRDRSG
ncbi:hypothetical protein J6590_004193 [Homalodisca vitripennis]|nr:hypothetical protein J6590_004193 [Homalodisca vitripennis]